MSKPKIIGVWPQKDESYLLGRDGVTSIEEEAYNPEPYCSHISYIVKFESGESRQFNDRYVWQVRRQR